MRSVTYIITPHGELDDSAGHVHQLDVPLRNLTTVLGHDARHILCAFTHSNHICKHTRHAGLQHCYSPNLPTVNRFGMTIPLIQNVIPQHPSTLHYSAPS